MLPLDAIAIPTPQHIINKSSVEARTPEEGSLSEPLEISLPHALAQSMGLDVCVVQEQLLDQGSCQASWPQVPAPRAQEPLGNINHQTSDMSHWSQPPYSKCD